MEPFLSALASSRRADWAERLEAVLRAWRYRSFNWGEADCVHFAHAVVCAVSARQWAQMALPPVRSARQAHRLLRHHGFHSLAEGVSALLGPSSPVSFAQRGDLVGIRCEGPFGVALGVCVGAHVVAPGLHGLVSCPLDQTVCCWRV